VGAAWALLSTARINDEILAAARDSDQFDVLAVASREQARKHVLVEKPFSRRPEEVERPGARDRRALPLGGNGCRDRTVTSDRRFPRLCRRGQLNLSHGGIPKWVTPPPRFGPIG
jgi:hypothetical protein